MFQSCKQLHISYVDMLLRSSLWNALQLSRLCSEADLRCELHLYPTEGHVLTPGSLEDADQRILRFFLGIVGDGSFSE